MALKRMAYFLSAAQERSFTRAARACGIKQPTLSQGIRMLEAEIGGQLFARTARGAELTPLGRAVRPHLAAAARSYASALKAAARHAQARGAVDDTSGPRPASAAGGESAGLVG
jgi:DNA-binding transcriptional LysR family regulator